MNVLRLAVVEIHVDKVPPRAAIDQAVRLMKTNRHTEHLSGLANAVLRNIARDGGHAWNQCPPGRLPEWVAKPVAQRFGTEALSAIEAAHERRPPIDLTPRRSQDSAALAQRLDAEILPTGSLRVHRYPQISALPGYAEGEWWVQDAAAAAPVRLLGELAGKTVVDICAAPGGKSMQCASLGAQLTMIERSTSRIKLLERNFARTGLTGKFVRSDSLKWKSDIQFDVVIVDAPCTSTGTIRRNPDLPHIRSGNSEDVSSLVRIQESLIERATSLVNDDGKILYCVCSLLPEEGEELITRIAPALGLRVERMDLGNTGLDPHWVSAEGGLRLRPDYWNKRGGMDGFFAAILKKSSG